MIATNSDTVNPANADCLHHSHNEDNESSTEVVNDIQNEESALTKKMNTKVIVIHSLFFCAVITEKLI